MPPVPPKVAVLGRFPPPYDGQTIATRRLAELLEPSCMVKRVNTEESQATWVVAQSKLRAKRVLHYIKTRSLIRDALASDPPDSIVLWTSVSPEKLGHWRDLLAVIPALGRKRRLFAVIHSGRFDALFTTPITRVSAWYLVNRVRALVFLSPDLAARCAKWIPHKKLLVIPNTIDSATMCTDREIAAKQARTRSIPRLLFLSNMIKSKGYNDVLHAVRQLVERGLLVRADFAGRWTSAEAAAAFDSTVKQLGLSAVVTHHGSVDDRETIKELHLAADVFLLPTYYPTEAQPIAILEALNAGTPVVVTAHGTIPSMVAAGVEGMFVPPHNPDAIARAVEHIMRDEHWHSMSTAARRRFTANYSPSAVREKWEQLLASS